MRKTMFFAVLSFGIALLCASCSKETVTRRIAGEGSLTLGVNVPVTKSALSADELLANAKVDIYYSDFTGLVRSYKYSEAPETIYLPANSYRVDVTAGEAAKASPAKASWEQKSYAGSSAFNISAGANTSVTVTANVSNAISKISFDSSIAENFQAGYSLTIGLDADDASSVLVYDESKSGCEGYFLIDGLDEPSISWSFAGTLSKDGSAFSKDGTVTGLEAGKVYKMTLKYTIKDGDVSFDLFVDYSTDVIDDTIVFEPVSTGLASSSIYEIWAGHATVHADVDETEFSDPSKIKFSYSSNGSDWTVVDAVRSGEGVYQATLTGLSGNTEYTYKLVIDGEEQGDPKTFTTEKAVAIPNGSFEYASLVSGSSYYKFYDPSSSASDGNWMFWGSGNGEGSEGVKGSAAMGITITDIDKSDYKVGSQSVLAKSGSILGMLTAGNIFVGQFAGLVGTSGGIVNFGRPWTSDPMPVTRDWTPGPRPTALRLWVKYTAGTMDIIGSNLPVSLSNKDYDAATINVALGTWNYKTYGGTIGCPVAVNTTNTSTFVDYDTDPSTVANGKLWIWGNGKQQMNGGAIENVANGDWRQITIPLKYHNETTYPTYIIIACAASAYGDYFTGCSSSKLWVDGVEFLYE